MRSIEKLCTTALLAAAATVHPSIAAENSASHDTAYPISHVVVIFQENVSFDDDSDGWYDHVMSPIVNQSQTQYDVFTDPNSTGTNTPLAGFQGRAGYGPRLPLIVISPFARENFVDHTITDQSSVLGFIEDNWKLGRIGNGSFDALAGSLVNMFDFNHRDQANRRLFLDPITGEPFGF